VKWLGGTAPTLETNPNSVNVLTFLTINGGTTWYGTDEQSIQGDAPYRVYLDYGYFGGGRNPSLSPVTTIDRIDYSNDTATASPRGPLSAARQDPPPPAPPATATSAGAVILV